MQDNITPCTCGTEGRIHAVDCGCHSAAPFLEGPTAAYLESRRTFLQRLVVGGISVTTLSLLATEAEADPFKPSAADQKRLGADAAQEVLKKYKEVKDDRQKAFQKVGKRLVDALSKQDRGDWDFNFRVVESKEVNAFALPGGNMFIHTALVDKIQSSDELAAVTGHEMAHVYKQHWANAVADRQKRRLGLAVVLGLARANSTWETLAGLGDTYFSLKYSRREEDQADSSGLDNLVAAQYDPRGMLDLFETLQKANGGGDGGVPDFLRTHPLTKDRIRRTRERIDKLPHRSPQ